MEYNCVAWAAGADKGWWWPGADFDWPFELPEDESLRTFIRAFNRLGFESCAVGVLEEGFERVAFYQSGSGDVSHVARQLSNGRCTCVLRIG